MNGEAQPKKKQVSTGLGCLIIFLALGGLFGGLALVMSMDSSPATDKHAARAALSDKSSANEDMSIEYQLAVISAGGYVTEDDLTVTRFRYLLDHVQSKTGYSRQDIADMTVKARDILRRKYGRDVNLLKLMDESWKTLSLDSGIKYEEILAANIQLLANQ